MSTKIPTAPRKIATTLLAWASVAACSGSDPAVVLPQPVQCGDLDPAFLADGGVGRDGIPALVNPQFVEATVSEETSYMTDGSRVIGVEVGGHWMAVPHNIMYRHEIVNLNTESERIAVTYCPLTGSALAFDRASAGGAEFGVSGLLYQANLIMYDRTGDDSLWPQMAGVAGCGPRQGQPLTRLPVVETTWGGWRTLFPVSNVVGVDLVDVARYARNPYGAAYEAPGNGDYLGFPIPRSDNRRLPKERVLGLPARDGDPPLAFPFHAMDARGRAWVADFEYGGEPATVLWDRGRFAATAVRPVADGRPLTLRIENDRIVDAETGSVWNVAGEAESGPLDGERMELISEAYVAFWLAWAAFHPETELFVQ